MANANINLVQLANTFDYWRTVTNNLANTVNELRNGNFYKDNGNFTLPNGTLLITTTSGTGLSVLNNVLFSALTTLNTSITTGLASFQDNVILSGANSSLTGANTITAPLIASQNTLFGNGIFRLTGSNTGNAAFISTLNGNAVVNIANAFFVTNVGNTEVKGVLYLSGAGTTLNVTNNGLISGNLTISKNAAITLNANVGGTLNVVGTILGTNEILSGTLNVVTANVGTETVTGILTLTTSTVANAVVAAAANIGANGLTITNDAVIGGNTKINVGNVTTLNVATVNVSGTINAVGTIWGSSEVLTGTLNVTTANITNESITGTANIVTANIGTESVTGVLTLTSSSIANAVVAATANIGANGLTVTHDAVIGGTITLNNVAAGNITTANANVSATLNVNNETVTGTLTLTQSTTGAALSVASGNVSANGATITKDLKVSGVTTLVNVTAGNTTTANANVSATLNVSVLQVGGNVVAYNVFLDTTNTYQIIAGNATFNNLIVQGTQTIVGNTVSASDTMLLRNTLATAGDGHLTIAQGTTNGNADFRFQKSTGIWQTTANVSNGYTTVITTANIADSVTNTSITAVASANAACTAYVTATAAYAQANASRTQANSAYAQANTQGIYANGTVTLANSANVNFNNTATVNVSSTANGATQANVAFSVNLTALAAATNNYEADILANGTLVLANANVNFNNTATVNVAVTANGTTQANISFAANGTALGIPAVNTALGTMNGNFGTINTTFGTHNTTFGTVNTTFSTLNSTFGSTNTQILIAQNTVAIYANGTLTLANANVNFNNTATVNVSTSANGTTQTNVSFTANGTALGIPAVNTALGTMNGNFGSINSAFGTSNGNFGTINSTFSTINSTFATLNTEIVNLNSAVGTINTSLGTINTTFAGYNSSFTTSQLQVNGTANVTGNTVLSGNVSLNVTNGIVSTSGTTSGTNGQVTRILLPGGAAFSNISATSNGAFRVALPPALDANVMLSMTIKIFEAATSTNVNGDSAGTSRILYVGGYIKTDNTWTDTFQTEETASSSNINIRYGKDSANNPLLWIGEFGSSNTIWTSPQIYINEVQAGYNSAVSLAPALSNNWSISQTDAQGSDTVTNGPFHVSKGFNEFNLPILTTLATINSTFATENTSLGTMNGNFGTINSTFATTNTTFGTVNTTFGTINSTFATTNTTIAKAANVQVFVGGTATGNSVNGNINFVSANSSNLSITGTLNSSPGNVTITFDTRLPSSGGGGGGNPAINQVSANYTFAVTDTANVVYHNSASPHTFSMNTHANVAMGNVVTVINQSGGGNVILANLTSVVSFIFAGTSLSGNRNLVANGMATLLQVATDTWFVSGIGIS